MIQCSIVGGPAVPAPLPTPAGGSRSVDGHRLRDVCEAGGPWGAALESTVLVGTQAPGPPPGAWSSEAPQGPTTSP